jgi:hypothetical protein
MSTLPYESITAGSVVIWTGAGGTRYEFEHHSIGTVFNPVRGVYIFCKSSGDGHWHPVYVGETDNFSRRLTDELASHHRWECICAAGATHICALMVADNAKRVAIETDLRHRLNPSCNRQ